MALGDEIEEMEFERLDNDVSIERIDGVEYEDDEEVGPKELTDEIRAFRQKNKEFQSTNDHETYVIVCFSTKEDKEKFLKECGIKDHTLVDGYQLAKAVGKEPVKPAYKLKKPLNN